MKRTMILALAAIATLSSCGGEDKNFIERMFDLESRSSKDAPPSTIEELKDGIRRYGDEVEKTAAAMEKVGTYWRMLAVRYLDKGLYGDAYDAAMKALRHYPDSSGVYYISGMSAAFLSKTAAAQPGGGATSRAEWLAAAEGAYRRSIEIEPRNTKALYGLAVLYTFELEDHEAAIAPIEALLGIETKNVDAMFVYARALYGSGRLEEAVDVYDRIIATTRVDEKKLQAADNKKRILDELYGG
ncbi:MAG TPA: tetratricopeptide repeat protein [Spirochaetia bacterium]|nr:tetratricopeptide repeat protein [Spirochaetaceae bacterium]HPE89118.1 tetratricopeptide repeat protein [Spirochaetales bacterium]HRW23950.1 tetratricopeptide repeat protein [Spirochaetia bacterium]